MSHNLAVVGCTLSATNRIENLNALVDELIQRGIVG